jgi:hypothetical protein
VGYHINAAKMDGTCFCWYREVRGCLWTTSVTCHWYEADGDLLFRQLGNAKSPSRRDKHLGFIWSQQAQWCQDICFLLVWYNSVARMNVGCPPSNVPFSQFLDVPGNREAYWVRLDHVILLGSSATHNAQVTLKVGRSHSMPCCTDRQVSKDIKGIRWN